MEWEDGRLEMGGVIWERGEEGNFERPSGIETKQGGMDDRNDRSQRGLGG